MVDGEEVAGIDGAGWLMGEEVAGLKETGDGGRLRDWWRWSVDGGMRKLQGLMALVG